MNTETNLELSTRNYNGTKWNTVIHTLKRKFDQGIYDSERAAGYIERYLVTDCAKQLHKDEDEVTWQTLYPIEMRQRVSRAIESELAEDFNHGAY